MHYLGKKQLNSLMTFLDNKGGNVKDGITGTKGDVAVRTVKAKRDADEAGQRAICFVVYFQK